MNEPKRAKRNNMYSDLHKSDKATQKKITKRENKSPNAKKKKKRSKLVWNMLIIPSHPQEGFKLST